MVHAQAALGEQVFYITQGERVAQAHQRTASEMVSGAKCRRLKREGAIGDEGIRPLYQAPPPALQHCQTNYKQVLVDSGYYQADQLK